MDSEQCFQQQDHDTTDEATKDDSMPLITPPAFVPPPLNSLFSPLTNIGADADCILHHLPNGSGKDEALISPVFPFPVHLPALVQHSFIDATMPGNPMPGKTKPNEAISSFTPDVLVVDTATDASVHMDDEYMNNFLDSVALELDEIME
ncbi:unnamed protein product [Peronospora destructor]|uniref:Uncharacterized protein n=1 Tax=Peronospora destructor TaxID=86335 RepID=A0AAV0TMU6_9STRA|nr:unnamed protein product [Peronospora destructor]